MRTDRTSITIECRRKKDTGKRGKVFISLTAAPPSPKPALSPVGQLLAEKAKSEEGQRGEKDARTP
jgi:hypothetical protein